MSTCGRRSRRNAPILLLCLLLFVMAACAAYLLRWRDVGSMEAVAPEPTSHPQTNAPKRSYTSRYAPTPVPTMPSPYLATAAATQSATPAPTETPAPTPTPEGLLGGKYAWRFTEEQVLTDHSYSDPTVSISWNMYRDELSYSKPVTFFVADVLVRDISFLKTAFAKKTYAAGGVAPMEKVAKSNNCIVAISGDFARWHKNGLIIRNGEILRNRRYTSDLCVLYRNGAMETYESGSVPIETILSMEPWQSWHFGPELLDHEGQIKKRFNTKVAGRNPRSVIGYYEPGHYCLVLVDGRQGKYSGGLNMQELSQLMHTLGCVRAYNLDGGATAHMTWVDKVINSPSRERKVNDVICVCFPPEP